MGRILLFLVIGAAATITCGVTFAQSYPNRPVRMVVPWPPGGGADSVVRIFANTWSGKLGQQVVIENRPGASGVVGTDFAQNLPGDGYNLLNMVSTTLINFNFLGRGFDAQKDWAPVGSIATARQIWVVNSAKVPGVKSIRELIEFAKSHPDLSFASNGSGSSAHLVMALFAGKYDLKMTHVPYKGGAPATVDLAAGRVALMQGEPVSVGPHIKAGTLTAIAAVSRERFVNYPDLPTLREQGFDELNPESFFGILATRGTAPEFVARLGATLKEAVADRDYQQRLVATGNEVLYMDSNEYGNRLNQAYVKWRRVIRDNNIKAE